MFGTGSAPDAGVPGYGNRSEEILIAVAVDRDKVLQAAQKLVEKKRYDKAVVEYQKLVADDPKDVRTLLKIGDLFLKMEQHVDAITTYERVGQFYSAQGFALKAIAVYKQIREIIHKHVPHMEDRFGYIVPKLAEIYTQLNLTSDALATYDEVATRLQRAGRDRDAIDIFKKIVDLDPLARRVQAGVAEAGDDDGVEAFTSSQLHLLGHPGGAEGFVEVVDPAEVVHRVVVGLAHELRIDHREDDPPEVLGVLHRPAAQHRPGQQPVLPDGEIPQAHAQLLTRHVPALVLSGFFPVHQLDRVGQTLAHEQERRRRGGVSLAARGDAERGLHQHRRDAVGQHVLEQHRAQRERGRGGRRAAAGPQHQTGVIR